MVITRVGEDVDVVFWLKGPISQDAPVDLPRDMIIQQSESLYVWYKELGAAGPQERHVCGRQVACICKCQVNLMCVP